MNIKFNQENFIDAYKDGEHLLKEHFSEIKKVGEFNPNLKNYQRLDEAGRLKVYTARDKGELVGYCAMFIYQDSHTMITQAKQEVLYVKPELRRSGLGIELLAYVDNNLRILGAKNTLQCVPEELDWSALLINNGYKKLETIYIKEL